MKLWARKSSRALSNYLWALPYLFDRPSPNSYVLDVGAYDLKDSVYFAKFFDCSVISFEADPENFQTCLSVHKLLESYVQKKILLDSRFLGSRTEATDFFVINPTKYGNRQASSKYKLNFEDRALSDPDYGLKDIQDQIVVNSVRYDETNYPIPHSVFMDAQGSELEVLQGFGERISEVQNIVLETSFKNSYEGSTTFPEVDYFLKENGFYFRRSSKHGAKKPREGQPNESFDFDVVYTKTKK